MQFKEITNIIFIIFKTRVFNMVPRKRIIIALAALLGAGVFLFRSLITTQLLESKTIKFRYLSQKKLADYQQIMLKDPSKLLLKIENVKDKLRNLENRFIPKKNLTKTIEDLNNLISQTENQMVYLDTKPFVSVGDYQKLPFSILAKGHYVDIIFLINRLETRSFLINIDNIKITPTERPAEVEMNLAAEVYVIRD